MSFKQIKYIFWQLFGMVVFVIAGAIGGYIYFVGEQKNAAKNGAAQETPISVEHPQGEPVAELKELEPVSFSTSTTSNAEKLAKVKAKGKSNSHNASTPIKETQKKATNPVAAATPKKETPKPAEKPKAATNKRTTPAKKANDVPAAQKPVALSSAQIRNMAINSADRLDYGGDAWEKAKAEIRGGETTTWEQTKEVAFAKLQTKSQEIEENDAWSMEKKRAAAEAIKKEQSEKSAIQKLFNF